MKKYKKETILAYLNGEDIPGFELDVLEEEPCFMSEAICLSQDEKLYDLCSDYVKRNYNFVKKIIENMASNEKFITKVVQYYFTTVSPDLEKEAIMEINLLLLKYLSNHLSPLYIKTLIICDNFYETEKAIYAQVYEKSEDVNFKSTFGLGFTVTLINYQNSNLIKEYIAERMLEEIFAKKENFCLENYLHQNFSLAQIKKLGLNSLLLTYIAQNDENLAGYIKVHPNLLTSLKRRISYLINRWEYFEKYQEEAKILAILDLITTYCEEFMFNMSLTEIEVISYIAQEFNLMNEFQEYDETFYLIAGDVKKAKIPNSKSLSLGEYSLLLSLKRKVAKILNDGTLPDSYLIDAKESQVIKITKVKKPK